MIGELQELVEQRFRPPLGLVPAGPCVIVFPQIIAPPAQGRRGRALRLIAKVAFQLSSRRDKPDGKSKMWVRTRVAWGAIVSSGAARSQEQAAGGTNHGGWELARGPPIFE